MSVLEKDRNSCASGSSEDFAIIFIGRELFYSNQTLKSVHNEFGVTARRVDSLGPQLAAPNAGKVLVVDQMLLEDLVSRPSEYEQAASSGCLVFAYRKDEAARFLFEHWDRSRFGDIGYLPMNVAPDVWRAILRLVMHEELYLPSFLADCLPCAKNRTNHQAESPHDAPAKEENPLYSKLTRREKQVLRLVSLGESNKAIASKLGITEHTVKLHMHNVSGKIGVSNRTAAAHFYFEAAPAEAPQTPLD